MSEKKTIEQLLEEQNELLRAQLAEARFSGTLLERKASADRWDAANPVMKYFVQNPRRR